MRRSAAALALAVVGLAACSSGSPARVPAAAPTAAVAAPTQPTVWLCRPGMSDNPCEGGLDATVVQRGRPDTVEPFTPAKDPGVDCFYVYPTVSRAPGLNAPLRSAPEIVATARAQAARFASTCRLFVPVYRQGTVAGLLDSHATSAQRIASQQLAYGDVLSAWHDYLRNDNGGRGVVLIGHSQGAILLRRLVGSDVDPSPSVRSRLVSAVLLGGNVAVAQGQDDGGDFTHVPACRAQAQTGCVVAWSSYAVQPPAMSLFGRTGNAGQQVLCTDPDRLAGGDAALTPYLPTGTLTGGALPGDTAGSRYRTGFVSYPGALTAGCRSTGGASYLLVRGSLPGIGAVASLGKLGSVWGLHTGDVNLALGDLQRLVAQQATAYEASH